LVAFSQINIVVVEYICWKFAGRLLDRVNTPLASWQSGEAAPLLNVNPPEKMLFLSKNKLKMSENWATKLCSIGPTWYAKFRVHAIA